jgi:hypothetical protein
VRITIQTSLTGGTILWKETHSVLTDPYGVLGFVVGNGTRVDGLPAFSDINWGSQILYIKTEIEYPVGTSYKDLGTSQLWSVPVSLVSKDLQGPVKKLTVSGSTSSLEEAIFEVKNTLGKTVLAVYDEGVRIHVDDGSKGTKGGFAVSSQSAVKDGTAQDYLQVTRDYTRVFSNNNPAKGVKGGFAVGGFDSKTDPNYYMNLTPDNYFIGEMGGANLTTGINNSTLGYRAGEFLTTGVSNVFVGFQAGHKTTEGVSNVMIGMNSGFNNINGQNNVFLGSASGMANTGGIQSWMGSDNIFIGTSAGVTNTEGGSNIFIGTNAGRSNLTGNLNIYIGPMAGLNATGFRNTFLGVSTGEDATTGDDNIFIGNQTGQHTSTGAGNTFVGSLSGWNNGTGTSNVYLGANTAVNLVDGNQNVMVGTGAGAFSTGGSDNVFIGNWSGANNDNSGSVFIGKYAGSNEENGNRLYIHNGASGPDDALIYGEFGNYPGIQVLKLNAAVTINDLLHLIPRSNPPAIPAEGDVYYDTEDHMLYVWNGTAWKNCW